MLVPPRPGTSDVFWSLALQPKMVHVSPRLVPRARCRGVPIMLGRAGGRQQALAAVWMPGQHLTPWLLLVFCCLQVPPPLSGRAAGNCMGQHRILLKGCNAKHGFYVFKYVYSFSTRRNQTQIKKEEANSQSTVPGHRLGEDNSRRGPTEDGVAPERGDNGSTNAMENGTGLKPKNHSAPGIGGDAHIPRPGTGTRARGGVGVAGPTPASSEGSGDLDLVVEVEDGVSILPQGGRPGKAMAGNRTSVRSEDRNDGAPRGVPVEGATTAGRERAPATGGAGDEGSGEATVPGQEQKGDMRGTGMGGATLASITENMEDVQVDAKGVDEYTYIPDSGSVTVTHGKVGSTVRATSFTQISPDKDDEVNIFIGRANIHVGEQETTQASATVGNEDDSIPTAGTSSSLPGLGITAAHDGDDNGGLSAHGQPEGPATTATPSHRDSVISSPGDGRPTGDDDGATTTGDGEGLVAPGPWRVADGDVTIPVGAGLRGNGDDEVTAGRLGFPMPARDIARHRADVSAQDLSLKNIWHLVPEKGSGAGLVQQAAVAGFKFPDVGDVRQSGDEGRKPELLGANWLELLLGSLRALLSQPTPPAPEKGVLSQGQPY
ncbi:PREDICTED: matrix extracellular phosphoglycoprotein [Pygoscelis adeliae]|uniref:matrix extracellular phosphoglycoprotein n=1 Tax=Pygoscelis adeliae TaxID=9238 RepID=UPI0004F4EA45|nr:PREDICTED: matrix extracellular phosphoglycoprotein [Pygoscelis adeliae]